MQILSTEVDYLKDGKGRVTYTEFLAMTENSGFRNELIDGEVFCLSSPAYRHQKVVGELLAKFYNWFKNKKCQPLTAPFDVTLGQSVDNLSVVQPDIVVIRDTDEIDEKGRYQGVPALVVEVLSEESKTHDMVRKLDLYMQTGIGEYWVVDPGKGNVFVYTFKEQDIGDCQVYIGDATVKSNLFDGLHIALEKIFSDSTSYV